MRLPWYPKHLKEINFDKATLRLAIIERRNAIRGHRDQKGDDRCWLDDYLVWAMLEDSSSKPPPLPPVEEAMKNCCAFYCMRRSDTPDPLPKGAILDRDKWDNDLGRMNKQELMEELGRIQLAIACHRDVEGRLRTIDDDRALYSTLPEKIPADFRLPAEAEFLGTAKAPHAGCPSFWRSHANCEKPCNLHSWGPCK